VNWERKGIKTTEVKQSYDVKSTGNPEVVPLLNYHIKNYAGVQRFLRIQNRKPDGDECTAYTHTALLLGTETLVPFTDGWAPKPAWTL
jgi:hypothetical protein